MLEHTYKQFDTDLEAVRARVLEMGGLVEDQVNKAVEALVTQNATLAEEVVANDVKVNALEVSSDVACTQIIVRRQPTASDLRMILTIIKKITDLERIGDEAAKIARYTTKAMTNDRIAIPRYSEIKYMSDVALKMLRASLDSFARVDPSNATAIARQDMEVDEEFHLKGLVTVKDIMKETEHPNACKDPQGKLRVGGAVGVGEGTEERVEALIEAGAAVLIVATAHGHAQGKTAAHQHALEQRLAAARPRGRGSGHRPGCWGRTLRIC